jgi:alkylation response protein AidB-like acyl-CoA dehydrogenase
VPDALIAASALLEQAAMRQEEEMFRQTVREFAQKEIRPHVREMDTKGQLPTGLVKKMADLGLLGITVPEKYGGPGAWNDPDYLLIGYLSNWKGQTVPTPLTPNEQYTHVSLWALVAAPLIFSGDITRVDEFTLGLLTNDE